MGHSQSIPISTTGITTDKTAPIQLAFTFTTTNWQVSSLGTNIPVLTYNHPTNAPITAIQATCITNSSEPAASTTRDCSVLAIDEFLSQCSNEFSAQTTSIGDLDVKITTLETNLNDQITVNTNDITQLQTDLANGNTGATTQIQTLQSVDDIILELMYLLHVE
eukprot:133535_1